MSKLWNVNVPRVPTSGGSLPLPQLGWGDGATTTVSTAAAVFIPAYQTDRDFGWEMCPDQNIWYTAAPGVTATAGGAECQYCAAGAVRYVYMQAGATISAIAAATDGYIGLIPL